MKRKLLNFLWVLALFAVQAHAQTRTITGTVTGKDDGLPLPGVTVMIQGAKTGTVTNINGDYTIKVPSIATATLVFSSVGYVTQTVTVSGIKQNVILESNQKALNEVLVVGYGTQTVRQNVGSIAQIKGSDIAETPVQNFEQALAGKAAGVQITVPNGVMNTPPIFHIRGTNSINLSSQPLIVVDGVVSFTGDFSGGESGGNALANINPDDIETIDILKDAAATAIYGSRGTNGVVVITTKKGKAGTNIVSLDSWIGANKVQRLPKVLDANQYVALKNEAMVNAGVYNTGPTGTQEYTTLTPDGNGNPINTDWEKLLYRTGVVYNTSLSLSGGTDKTKYYASLNYTKQGGVLQKNDFISKSMLFNIDHKANKFISFGAKLAYADQFNLAAVTSGSLSGEAYATSGLGREAILLPPNLGPYNSDGSYNINPNGGSIGVMNNKGYTISYTNPIPSLDLDRANNEIMHPTGNIYLNLNPLPWITLRSQYGVDYITSFNDNFADPVQNFSLVNGVPVNSASDAVNQVQYKRWDWVNTASFDYTLAAKHSISLLLGNEQQSSTQFGYGVTRSVLSDPLFNSITSGYTSVNYNGLTNSQNYLVSFFGRLNYNFDQKYFVSATLRRDGYSGFGSDTKYGLFPGFGLGWEVDKEKFWSKIGADKVISTLKLKGSYGKTGNYGVGDFASYSFYGYGLYNGAATLGPSSTGNTHLGWESARKSDVGFNFGLFNDRITGDFDLYRNDITDLIFSVPSAPSAGLASNPQVNVGSMYNQGIEFNLSADVVRNRSFKWNTNFNIGFNQNKVTSLYTGATSFTTSTSSLEIANITQVGLPLSELWIISTAGVDPANGRRIFINGQGQKIEYTFLGTQHYYYYDGPNAGQAAPAINQNADSKPYGNTTPKYTGGFTNSFRYKNFDATLTLTYQLGFYVYYGTGATLLDQRFWNNSVDILNHWTTPGQVAKYPQVVFGDNVSNGTSYPVDFNVYNGNFLKVKSLNIGYTLPKTWLKAAGDISSVRFYASSNNLLIFTKYPGPDPEVGSNGTSNAAQGVDRNTAANSRTFTFGVSVKF